MYLSYPVDPLAEPLPLSSFLLFFCLLPWGAFSIYGLLAFSVANKGLRGCCYELVRIHIDPENASNYSYFLSLLNNTKEGKFNRSLIQDFLLLHSIFKGRDNNYHTTITAISETFCFLTKKYLFKIKSYHTNLLSFLRKEQMGKGNKERINIWRSKIF